MKRLYIVILLLLFCRLSYADKLPILLGLDRAVTIRDQSSTNIVYDVTRIIISPDIAMQISVAVGGSKTECGVIEAHAEKPADQEQGRHPPAVPAQGQGAGGERDDAGGGHEILGRMARRLVHGGIGRNHGLMIF